MQAIGDYYVAPGVVVTGDVVLSVGVNLWFGRVVRVDLAHHRQQAVGGLWNGGGGGPGVREGPVEVRQVSRCRERMRTDENQDQRLHRCAEQPV